MEKVDGNSADHGADMVLDRANARTRYHTSEFLRRGKRTTFYTGVEHCVCVHCQQWCVRSVIIILLYELDEYSERVQQFRAAVRGHRQFRRVAHRSGMLRKGQ